MTTSSSTMRRSSELALYAEALGDAPVTSPVKAAPVSTKTAVGQPVGEFAGLPRAGDTDTALYNSIYGAWEEDEDIEL